jgi:hypothetical protein
MSFGKYSPKIEYTPIIARKKSNMQRDERLKLREIVAELQQALSENSEVILAASLIDLAEIAMALQSTTRGASYERY